MSSKGKILIVDDVHPFLIKGLQDLHWEIDYFPDITVTKIKESLSWYQGIIVRSKLIVDKEIIDLGRSLKFIARAGAGMDNIEEEYAKSKNIICINAPEGNRDAVADHALLLLLSLIRNLKKSIVQIKNGIWDREGNRGLELEGKTIAIIGFGNNGEAFAKRLSTYNCTIITYDKYKKIETNSFVQQVKLEEVFEQADVLSLHIPLTEETKNWIDKKFISKFKKPIYLINTSRGKICKESDLFELIKEGKISGLALDVLENENLKSLNEEEWNRLQEFNSMENVIITPHIAGWTKESYIKISKVLLQKIEVIN